MLQRVIAVITLASAAVLYSLLVKTTPAAVGPLGVLIFFVFIYLTALGVLAFMFYGVSLAVGKIKTKTFRLRSWDFRRAYYHASVVALAPVMLLALQTVSRVGPYQVLLIVFFMGVAWVYIVRRVS